MKIRGSKKIKHIQIVFTTLLFSFLVSLAHAAPSRVAILPFDVNAASEMTFLQEGIVDMLSSRIAWKDNVEIINENKTKAAMAEVDGSDAESRALLVGKKLQADYVLFGSLTVFGDSVSIDAKMADVTGEQPPLPFYAQTQGMGAVIPQINQFAANINETVFGRSSGQQPKAVPPPATAAAPAPQTQQAAPPTPDPRMHPEKLLQSGITSETPVPVADQPYSPNPAFVPAVRAVAADNQQSYWKSRRFKALITGLDIADVDSDGRNDLVFVTNDLVSIYSLENGRLVKKAQAVKSKGDTFISVDAGDINGNGTPELYVTSLGPGKTKVNSFVLEYSNGTYTTLSDGNNWYYRVARTVDKGWVLLGQRHRLTSLSIFTEPIHEMRWEGNRPVPDRVVLAGGKANLMGLAYGDITHEGTSTVAAYSDHDLLYLYSGSNEKIWEDGYTSGGDMLFFNLPRQDKGDPNHQYFPLRIRTTDVDRDGKREVMVVRHDDLAKNMMRDFRQFKKAKIESLFWNDLGGLASQWQTQTISGRISDFVVGDVDNDGVDELVIALVSKEGKMIFTDSLSSVIAFDLNAQ